jgi:nitric oxide reductase subunit B
MCVGSLLPVGLFQTWAAVDKGYWYARSAEFLTTPLMQTLRWMRVPGDTLFACGAVALVIFVAGIRPKSRTFPVSKTRPVEVAGD